MMRALAILAVTLTMSQLAFGQAQGYSAYPYAVAPSVQIILPPPPRGADGVPQAPTPSAPLPQAPLPAAPLPSAPGPAANPVAVQPQTGAPPPVFDEDTVKRIMFGNRNTKWKHETDALVSALLEMTKSDRQYCTLAQAKDRTAAAIALNEAAFFGAKRVVCKLGSVGFRIKVEP